MVPILIYPLKLPYDSHLSTFITEGGKGKENKNQKPKNKEPLLVLGNRIKFIVLILESNLILEKGIISM